MEFPTGEISSYTVQDGVQALRITAAGGSGGNDEFGGVGGPGAVLTGTFAVAEGDELRVLAGTAGATEPGTMAGGGGGGGSFVGVGAMNESAFSVDNLLVVAGGGGGSNSALDGGAGGMLDGEGGEGPLAGGGGLNNGTGGAGASGDFGVGGDGGGAVDDGENGSGQTGGGGAGASGDGGNSGSASGGLAAVDGGEGGTGTSDGGFGGGGGAVDGGGGGGGGFAGGGGSSTNFSGDSGGGGGGGSFFADGVTDPSSAATNEGDGFVFFCEITAPPLAFAKSFAPASIPAGGTSTLTFTIDNTGSEFPAEELAFTDSLPSGVLVADPANASTECGGTLTATAGSTTIAFSDGAVEAGASCTVSVDVTSATPGSHENTSSELTSSAGTSDPATATLEVGEVTKTFEVETATGTGTASGSISGGGPGCAVGGVEALAVEEVAPQGPPEVELPHGLIALELTGCEDGASVEVTLNLPSEVPLGSEYWKYGPTQDQEEPHWYTLESAGISDSTVTFTLVDGGAGDGDLTVDGTIVDPGGPAGVPPVPALPRLALVLLLALLAWAASRTLRRLDRHPPASHVR